MNLQIIQGRENFSVFFFQDDRRVYSIICLLSQSPVVMNYGRRVTFFPLKGMNAIYKLLQLGEIFC